MSYQVLRNWLRRIKIEIREIITQETVPGQTDAIPLSQIQELISAEPVRKKRKEMKDVFALLIWNMTSGDNDAWKRVELIKDLDPESIGALSRIEEHLKQVSTSWDRKRSKWTYVCLIREMEPTRMYNSCDIRSGRMPTSADATKIPANGQNLVDLAPNENRRSLNDIPQAQGKARSVDMGGPASGRTVRPSPSVDGVYLVTARNELAIGSLEQRLVTSEARLQAYEDEIASLRSLIDKLMRSSSYERVSTPGEGRVKSFTAQGRGNHDSGYEQTDGKFVFFDAV